MLTADGWVMKNQEGSHRHFVHPTKPGKVQVAGQPGKDIAAGTLNNVKKQAGLK